MLREAERKSRQRRAYVCSQSNRTERHLGHELRGCYPARRGPCHLHPAGCRGGVDQGPERHDRERQHYGIQGEHGDHLRPGRVLKLQATRGVYPGFRAGVFSLGGSRTAPTLCGIVHQVSGARGLFWQRVGPVGGKRNTTGIGAALYTGTVIRLGYPTQNLTIPASTNRTLRLANLSDVEKLKGLVRANISDLKRILRWNADHGVGLFRMGQSLIPFASHPSFPYDWETEHGEALREAGELARDLGIRLSMHPGQYINPGSLKSEVVERSLAELRYLALENDARVWTVAEVILTAGALGIPAITDAFHHDLNPGDLTLKEALDLSLPTWATRGARPKLHLSSQDPVKQGGAHAYAVDSRDWQALLGVIGDREADVMVEGKEHALAPMGVK